MTKPRKRKHNSGEAKLLLVLRNLIMEYSKDWAWDISQAANHSLNREKENLDDFCKFAAKELAKGEQR